MASHRNRKNSIARLKNEDGAWVTWDLGLPNPVLDFYMHLFTSCQGDPEQIVDCVDT